jgi:hypothetical protein
MATGKRLNIRFTVNIGIQIVADEQKGMKSIKNPRMPFARWMATPKFASSKKRSR